MLDPVLLVIYALAVARVVGLVVADTITEPLRDRIIAALDNRPNTLGSAIAYLITCPWCASIWVAVIAAPLIWFFGASPIMVVPALALALSQIVGMTAGVNR